MLLESLFITLGLGGVLFSSVRGGNNTGIFVVGFFFIILGVIVAFSEIKEKSKVYDNGGRLSYG
jgi:uncharacterized membrane protein